MTGYNLDIKFQAGKTNANADALSQFPMEPPGPASGEEEPPVFASSGDIFGSQGLLFRLAKATIVSPYPVQVNLSDIQMGMTTGEWQLLRAKTIQFKKCLHHDSQENVNMPSRGTPSHSSQISQGEGVVGVKG